MRLALAFAAGAAWVHAGAPVGLAPIVAVGGLAWPTRPSARPDLRLLWIVAALAGVASAGEQRDPFDCVPPDDGPRVALDGVFLAVPTRGSGPFRTVSECGTVTAVVPEAELEAGRAVRLVGEWRRGRHRPWFAADSVELRSDPGASTDRRWLAVRWRSRLRVRMARLFEEQAPLAVALTLARREGLDPSVREDFARVGIAHLLAISGFHVGVIASVVLGLLRFVGIGSRSAALGSAGATWLYVALIGFPDAAARAALILFLVALSRASGRPPARWGALGSALLLLLALDPGRLATPGFQLSFAGAAGLVAWAGPLTEAIRRFSGRRCPRSLAAALAAGVAATGATLPVAAWHFERISLVGIPATLAATPLVALALTGTLLTVATDFVWPELAGFLAGGVGVVLWALEAGARKGAEIPFVSVWTARGTVAAGAVGVIVAGMVARRPGVGARSRRLLSAAYVCIGISAWPLLLALQGRGSVEILMIDVGQGDAIALRSPGGRWLLVDAGLPPRGPDPGAHPVVRALRARGVRRLEALMLTHPDLDHIGGAAAVLASFDVGVVRDPALPAGKDAFVDLLRDASARGIPWLSARAGDRVVVDDLVVEVLHPPAAGSESGGGNATSLVLRLRHGDFDALLTGDAYKDVERQLVPSLEPGLEVLKVGHHGSDTSTDTLLLTRTRPRLGLISVGRYNRYGHPSAAVLDRLSHSGVGVRRTDRDGTISVVGRVDGSFSIASGR